MSAIVDCSRTASSAIFVFSAASIFRLGLLIIVSVYHDGNGHTPIIPVVPNAGTTSLVEGFFSKLARSVLRHIRVASNHELKDRIMAAMDEFNRNPVVHTWSYKLDQAA